MKTKKTISLSQAGDNIPNNKPMIFWDTCALLDIIRIPIRKNLSVADLVRYEYIADVISREEVVSVTSALVMREFFDHYKGQHQELLDNQNKLNKDVTGYAVHATDIIRDTVKDAMESLDVEDRLVGILQRILENTFVMKPENIYRDFADFRLHNEIAPADRKAEYKDCYIWGTFIELIRKLGNTVPYASFVTKNSEDYEVEKGKLYPQIKADCNIPSMRVVLDMGKLKGDIKTALGNL